ncbi:MAG: acyl transferase domain-containing protein/acyl carrier protein, partial [Myxococcota bacterium]
PFVFQEAAQPWPSETGRHAAVSAFGFGGTNFHVVLSEYTGWEEPAVGFDNWATELFLFRGGSQKEATARAERLLELIERDDAWRLCDLARSVCQAGTGAVHFAVVASDLDDLRAKLGRAVSGATDPRGVFQASARASEGIVGGKTAFLFPGQGSQRPQMMRELFVAFPEFQRYLSLGSRWVGKMYPPAAWDEDTRRSQKAAITDTRVAQPALGIVGLAAADLLYRLGLRADMMGGHSYGELVALCVSGALDEADLLELSEARGECILAASGNDPGTMAAVSASADDVLPLLDGVPGVVIANHNAPTQSVISGPTDAVDQALARIRGAGFKAKAIPVACAFHSSVVASASKTLARRLSRTDIGPLGVPVWSNTTAEPYPTDPDGIRERLAQHVALPVRFVAQIESMYEAGARVFVESGPGRVLTGLVGRILGDRPHVAVASDRGSGSTLTSLQMALAELAVHGVAVDTAPLFQGRASEPFDLDFPPSVGPAPTSWLINGHMARPVRGTLPSTAMIPILEPIISLSGGTSVPSSPSGDRDQVMIEYLSTMKSLVETQREVMLGYLGNHPAPAVRGDRAAHAATVLANEAVVDIPVAVVVAPVIDLREALLGIVSERTGYPVEMLDMDLDLEADLSIDSIKRIEILGALGEQLGLADEDGGARDEMIERLSGIKTLRGIVEWLDEKNSRAASADAPVVDAVAPLQLGPAAEPELVGVEDAIEVPPLSRYVLRVEDAPTVSAGTDGIEGQTFAIVADRAGVADSLRGLLERRGADVTILEPGQTPGLIDGLIFLYALTPNGVDPAKALFEAAQAAVRGGARRVMAATAFGGAFGRSSSAHAAGGISGLIKTVGKEYPDVRAQVVDLDPSEEPAALAAHLYAELLSGGSLVEVGYQGEARHILNVVAQPAEAPNGGARALGTDAVVLITGGARGITARVAIELARRFQCTLELVGRSPEPGAAEDAATADIADGPGLRKLLAGQGELKPRGIEREVRRILAERQMRATFAAVRAAGGHVRYHAVDVRDRRAFGALVEDVYARHDRLDGVIHGAGVLEDKLIEHKTSDSFSRVFDTKVCGAQTLAETLRADVGFVVFFSSVSGAFGNRGQVAYAAANDALDKLAVELDQRLAGRVLSINWGPWGGTGMVTPELEREYARRGIGLIEPVGGVEAFVDEITDGHRHDAQVIYMAAAPEQLQ